MPQSQPVQYAVVNSNHHAAARGSYGPRGIAQHGAGTLATAKPEPCTNRASPNVTRSRAALQDTG